MRTTALCFSLLTALCFTAVAEDAWWNVPRGGKWSETANWTNGVVANGEGVTANFTDFPGPDGGRDFITLDTDIELNGLKLDAGSNQAIYFSADLKPDGSLYSIDIGSNDLEISPKRTVNWKIPVVGSGEVKFSGSTSGFFDFRVPQPFTGALFLQQGSAYKGISYQSYADSTNACIGDLLTTRELKVDRSTFRFGGRYPRAASSWATWEVTPGSCEVKLLGTNINAELWYAPGQIVTGDYVPEDTFIRYFKDDSTLVLSQPIDEQLGAVTTQPLSFKAAPLWDITQSFDRIVTDSAQAGSTCGIQFQPLVAAGGTNTLTLRSTVLTGNMPVQVSVDGTYSGWDGRLHVDYIEDFPHRITLQNRAALILSEQRAIPTMPAPDAVFWVDASNLDSITKDIDDQVSVWSDTRGAGYPQATSWLGRPTWKTNALNGLPVIDFGATGDARGLAWSTEISAIQTVFWVIGSQEGGGSLLGRSPNGSAHSFKRGFDALFASSTYVGRDNGLIAINEGVGENVWLNGELVHRAGTGLSGEFDLVTAQINPSINNLMASAFGYVATQNVNYNGGQQLAEVIIYTRALTAQEIDDTEAYLMKKWFKRDRKGYGIGKVNQLATNGSADGRLMVASEEVAEIHNSAHAGSLTITEGSSVKFKSDGGLKKLTLEDGAKAIISLRQVPTTPPLAGNILWLDASQQEDLTLSGDQVMAWRNRGGGSVEYVTPGSVKPTLEQGANGQYLVDLGALNNGCCLMTLSNLMARTIFVMWYPSVNGAQFLGSLKQGYAGHNEFRNDFTRNGKAALLDVGTRTGVNGRWFQDSLTVARTAAVPLNRLLLTSAVMQGWAGRVSAMGGYGFDNTPATYSYSGGYKLAEVLLYDITLSDNERRDIEAYLMRKWLGSTPQGYADESGAVRLPEVAVTGSATLEIEGSGSLFITTVGGSGTLTTSGSVTIGNLLNPNSLEVTPSVSGVQITRSGGTPSAAAAAGAIMHLDASDASSITIHRTGGLDYAQNWRDKVAGVLLESAYGPLSWIPKIKTDGPNGLTVIDFDQRGSNRGFRWSPRLDNIRTVFWMVKDKGETQGGGFLLGTTDPTYAASHFARGGNNGTLKGNSGLFNVTRVSPGIVNGQIFIDGTPATIDNIPKWDWQVISVVSTSDCSADQIAADRTSNWANSGGIELGELIIYSNELSEAECAATEDYLMNKWLARRSPRMDQSKISDVVAAWGSVPVYVTQAQGYDNTIAVIQGNGEVVIDGAEITLLSDAGVFSGRIVLRNNSTLNLKASLLAAATVVVESGSTLNLGGQLVSVAAIAGDGVVANGSLRTAHVLPGSVGAPGTLTIQGDLLLEDDATFTVFYARPDCGKLVVEGRLIVMGGGTVEVSQPVGLGSGFGATVIEYAALVGGENLFGDWHCMGDYNPATYDFRLEPGSGASVRLSGYAAGTLLLIR